MKKLISCEYNFDNCCVELKFTDGSMIAIDTIAVENEVADNMYQRSRSINRSIAKIKPPVGTLQFLQAALLGVVFPTKSFFLQILLHIKLVPISAVLELERIGLFGNHTKTEFLV